VHDIKQTVSLTEVVMKNKRRSITHGIDTHDAAGGHFQLFFAAADENNSLTKSNAVALPCSPRCTGTGRSARANTVAPAQMLVCRKQSDSVAVISKIEKTFFCFVPSAANGAEVMLSSLTATLKPP
jgi:hypothetical protein